MEDDPQRVENPEGKPAHGSISLRTLRNAVLAQEKRWAFFLTPLRLTFTITLFVLGVWVHSVYDNHVTMEVTFLQNALASDGRLAAVSQEIAGLREPLAQDEESHARRDARLSGWIETGVRDRREALQQQAAESSKAIARLDARLSGGLLEVEAALRKQESADGAWRAQSEAVSAELFQRLAASGAEREEHVRKLELLNTGFRRPAIRFAEGDG